MVNDWVLQEDGTPIQMGLRDLCGIDCGQLRVEPIPLTEDMLKINLFFIHKIDEKYYEWLGGRFRLLTDAEYEEKFPMLLKGTSAEIRYVHELQHVLRLCGKNDLADNFRVE